MTVGATIYYTTDGSTPTENSLVYNGIIPVSFTTTIKAVAVRNGCIKSSIKSVKIVVNGSEIITGENIAIAKTAYTSSVEGTNIANNVLANDEKTRWSSLATDDEYCYVDLGEKHFVNKIEIKWEAAYASNDAEHWITVHIGNAGKGDFEAGQVSVPQFSLEPGSYIGNQLLSIASETTGVEIHYTIDGSIPTKDSKLYVPTITLKIQRLRQLHLKRV